MTAQEHDIDPTDVDDLDEIDGNQQYAYVWCRTHQTYEWHYVDRDLCDPGHRTRAAARRAAPTKGTS